MNKCEICGLEYEPIIYSQKYCSNYCREIAQIPKKDRPSVYSSICPFCGKEFKSTGVKTKYCSVKCRTKYNSMKHYNKIKKPKNTNTTINSIVTELFVDEYILTTNGHERVLKKGKFKRLDVSKDNILDILPTLYYKHIFRDDKNTYIKKVSDTILNDYLLMYYANLNQIYLYERIDNE